jgi:hypothetical protein
MRTTLHRSHISIDCLKQSIFLNGPGQGVGKAKTFWRGDAYGITSRKDCFGVTPKVRAGPALHARRVRYPAVNNARKSADRFVDPFAWDLAVETWDLLFESCYCVCFSAVM